MGDSQKGDSGQAIAEFVDKLIDEKGFPDITPEIKDELRRDITQRLDDFIAARVIAELSDEKVLEFEEMLKQGKPEGEIQAFVTGNVPNFTDFLAKTLMEFREVYLGLISAPPGEDNPQSVS